MQTALPGIVCALTLVLTIASGCGGGGGGASPGLDPGQSARSFVPPPAAPPAQFDTGSRFFGTLNAADLDLPLPLYGLVIPTMGALAPGNILGGRQRNWDDSIGITFMPVPGQTRSAQFPDTSSVPFIGVSGDVLYLEYKYVSADFVPVFPFGAAGLAQSRYGAIEFSAPAAGAIVFYAGFETPVGAGPITGTVSYLGSTLAAERSGSVERALFGVVSLEVDFHSNRMFGAISNMKIIDGSMQVTDYDHRFLLSDVTLVDVGGARGFVGDLLAQRTDDGAVTGSPNAFISGRFFGASALEAAGLWGSDAVAGREIWGSFGATVGVSPWQKFPEVGVLRPIPDRTAFRVSGLGVAAIPSGLASSDFSPGQLGALYLDAGTASGWFGAPGSADPAPLVQPPTPFYSATGAHLLVGTQTLYGREVTLAVAERGTLAYARYGYWTDTALGSGITDHTYFSGGVLTSMHFTAGVPSNGQARYVGTAIATVVDGANVLHDFAGTALLVADFGAGNVSGTIDYLVRRGPGGPLPIDRIRLDDAGVVGDAFTGSASAESGGNPIAGFVGTHGGHFLGPTADEIAGVWTLSGGSLQSWGSYGASR